MEGIIYIPQPMKWEINFIPQLVDLADAYGIDDTDRNNLPVLKWLLLETSKLN
jgi:hypothetical protein